MFTTWGGVGAQIGRARMQPYADSLNPSVTGRSMVPLDYALPAETVPEGLDWDLWVGPAPWRPYNPCYHVNPIPEVVPWSFCEDFGLAMATWIHAHSAEVLQYAIGQEETGPVDIIHPGSGEFPTLSFRYANGVVLHLVEGWDAVKTVYGAVPDSAELKGAFGGVVVGEKGWLTTMSEAPITGGPDELMAEYNRPEHDVDMGGKDHHANWLECIKTRNKPNSHEELGHRAASLGQLTIIGYKLGRSLKWDPVREHFPEDLQANRLLRRARRAPWHI